MIGPVAYAVLDSALLLTFLFCVCYAIITDFQTLLIPNWISLTLIGAFVVFATIHVAAAAITGHLFVAAIVLTLSITFFVLGWIGGGDVKFMSAIALWMGPDYIAPFTVLMASFGAALAICLIGIEKYGAFVSPRMQDVWPVSRLRKLARSRECPYGVAIGTAGLLLVLQIFARAPTP